MDMSFVRGMGRRFEPDENDQKYLMRLVAPPLTKLPPSYIYERGPTYNQGMTGTCVAHGWRAWMDGAPLRTKLGPTPFELYDQCIKVDQWDDNDEDPERVFGTSVRAGAKVLTKLGHVKSYLWAFTVDDVRNWMLSGRGGVVTGFGWKMDMRQPTTEGIIRATGGDYGGHSTYLFGADDRIGAVLLQNSWGKDWGGWPHPRFPGTTIYRGCAKLPYEDLERLLRDQGEACTAIETKVDPRVLVH